MTVNGDRQFLDTNVLVYAHDISAGQKHTRAKNLISELWESGNGCLSLQVLQEFYVTVTLKVPLRLEPRSAARIIAELANRRVHIPKVNDLLEAIEIQQDHQISFRDAMIIRSAQVLGCKTSGLKI